MKKELYKKVLAGFLSFALALPSGSILALENGQQVLAAEDDNTVLDKILGAEDISLRMKWNDQSNIGEEHSVALSNGSITVKDNGTMRELTAQQLADTEMGVGINLGNTMEATHAVENKASLEKTSYDTGWGQPVTTREYINCLHSYGINTIRIPIAWSNGDIDDGTYTIRSEMLDRIEEVVNYALDNGMYVIINDHWDNQWWGQFGACKKDDEGNKVADEEVRAAAWTRYERYWTQICERFNKYSDHLIFEGANEELGTRLNDAICLNGPAKGYAKPGNAGSDIITLGGNLTTDELYETTNKINQKFVDIVRASGGNNVKRHLLIAGYDTDIAKTTDERFVMPEDIEENGKDKLFLSVHYYTPWDFCGDGSSGTYTIKDQKATEENFQKLKKFSDEGYAVIVGECGVCEPSAVTGSVTQWYNDTFTSASVCHGVPVMWENGNLFDREEPSIFYKDMAIFLNTVNGTEGDTSADRNTGGEAPGPGSAEVKIPEYLDSNLWKTPGIHAYLSYQTSTWDYRNSYKPVKNLGNNEHSWEYVQASGSEVTTDTKITDVQVTADGEYTILIENIDLSSANSFNSLGISTDINKELYPGITVTDATLKIDGKTVTEPPVTPVIENDDAYYKFMLVNKWGADNYPLTSMNDSEELKGPLESIGITFKINGLSQALADIESGEYINPETGKKISETEEDVIKIPEYLNSNLWKTPGIHAYLAYQTAAWDYRNPYKPQKELGNNEHSWEYVQASGSEVTTDTKITDVQVTADGEYTIAIEGIDLSSANSFNSLGISTDIKRELYPGITVTDATLKVDGKAVTESPVIPVAENEEDYYRFMLVNIWGAGQYPLAGINENEKLAVPAKSIEITFKINGLSKALTDIKNGEYINPETGEKIPATETPGVNPPEDTPTETPAATLVPTKQPVIAAYPPSITTPQDGGQTPAASTTPVETQTPGISPVPVETTAPEGTQIPGTSTAPGETPATTQTPGTTTEIKKDDVTGAVTEITTTISGNNVSTVVEKTTLADGTQNTKETITEDVNGIVTIKETSSSNKANVTLVKNITKYTDGDIISTDAVLYTGNSEINSNYSAKNTIPESLLNEAKDAGISSITFCIGKDIVDDVKTNKNSRMVIKIEVPQVEGISAGKVILSEEAIKSAVEGNRRFVVKMLNENQEDSYTVTIPPSELNKMQGDIDISIKAGKVSQAGGSRQENIESILSANGIKAENAAIVSIASNNTDGGIKASAPVVTQSIKAGDKVYVYCYNNKTGKLEEIANSERTVLKNTMTGIEGYSGNDYVVTEKELSGKNVVTLLSQSKVSFSKTSVKKGSKININITLPEELEAETSLKKEVPYAKQAAVVTYKSSNTKAVKVSKDNTLKAAGKGKAVITVKIKLAGGKVKTVKKNVTVK